MTTELAVHRPVEVARHASVPELLQMAELFAQSGMFKDAQSVATAFVKIQAGAEMGVQPFQAMSGVHVIQGKPVVGANLLASLLDQHPSYSYLVEWSPTRDACTVTISKNGSVRGSSTFSMADAERAGLLANPTWKKYPENMLFARAMSNAVRWYAGAVTGGAPVYVDGEVEELEPVDLAELSKKPSEEPLPRTRATKEEEQLVAAARKKAGMTTRELSAVLDEHGEGAQAPYSDQIPAILAAIEAFAPEPVPADQTELIP